MSHHAASHHPAAHHLEITASHLEGNSGLGRYVFLPGSPGRAAGLASGFLDHRVLENRRGHDVHLGYLERGDLRVDVAAVATGMMVYFYRRGWLGSGRDDKEDDSDER